MADRFLEVRGRLDKPGERPEYEFGEPVVIELDIRNMSEGHLFTIPYSTLLFGEPMMPATQYVVETTRFGKPIPLTTFGRMTVERLNRGDDIEGGDAHRFAKDLEDPRSAKFPHTEQPFLVNIRASLLCDMTALGDYELQVRFPVRVFSLAKGEGRHVLGTGTPAVKEVRLAKPLRLRVVGRIYRLEPSPVKGPPTSEP
ncbi:MAG: hypothetical protein WKF75_03745 [Singulisphaera sp.]